MVTRESRQYIHKYTNFIIMGDKIRLQSWVFDLFIVSRNFTPNVAVAIL